MSDLEIPERAGLDIGVDFSAHLSAGLDAIRAEVSALRAESRRGVRKLPTYRRDVGSPVAAATNAYPAAGNLSLVIDGPQQNMQFTVRRIVVGGLAANVIPAGSAYLFVATTPPADLTTTALADYLPTLGVPKFYSDGQIIVLANENLYCVVTGGTPTTYYTVQASLEVYDLTAMAEQPVIITPGA